LAVKPDDLKRQVSLLLSRGWRPATFTETVLAPPASRTFAVTFDDAFLSVLELGLPVLSELGVPATLFAPTAFMDRRQTLHWAGIDSWLGGPHDSELYSMDWDDLRELADSGWEIGSHTRSHRHLAQLSDAELQAELTDSRADLEAKLARTCRALAYPYGYADRRAVTCARRAGYQTAADLPRLLRPGGADALPDPLLYPRTGVYRIDAAWRFRAKVSPIQRLLARPRPEQREGGQ
jgi:peptidoglycan/xylan/chitin deacetylase (PgdA/CDA1 family)